MITIINNDGICVSIKGPEYIRPHNCAARRLSGNAFKVYVYLHFSLVKKATIDDISISLGMNHLEISEAVKELMNHGYLFNDPDDGYIFGYCEETIYEGSPFEEFHNKKINQVNK